MPQHVARWGYPESVEAWRDQVGLLRTYLQGRPGAQRQQLIDHLDLGETVQLRVVGSDPEVGSVRVNSVVLAPDTPGVADPADWSGTYFADVPVTLEAVPVDGHRFVSWEGVPAGLADDARLELTLDGDTTVRAVFARS
jgi:hypothetical protein